MPVTIGPRADSRKCSCLRQLAAMCESASVPGHEPPNCTTVAGVKSARSRLDVGWREWLTLPELGLPAIKAKVDTGARTSALHAWRVEPYTHGGAPWVRFHMHPLQRDTELSVVCDAPVHDRRMVSDSGGHREMRHVIETPIELADYSWDIEVTLTDRDTMLFRMLLGRQAMPGLRVFPDASFLTKPSLSVAEATELYADLEDPGTR